MKLLVGSIFLDDSPVQLAWANLQAKFLTATTREFDYVITVHKARKLSKMYKYIKVLPRVAGALLHLDGLLQLLEYFQKHKNDYDNFLFLDNDAFPIRQGWCEILLAKMRKKQKEIAAAQRLENFDFAHAHSSILFVPAQWIVNISFKGSVRIPQYEGPRCGKVFPLVRSNYLNIDPILCSIHYGMFYHHGCGSRNYDCRGVDYWSGIVPCCTDVGKLRKQLSQKPDQFISELAGPSYIKLF